MMKKRLLITGSTFPRYKGDTEPRFILDLARYLNEYAEVTVLVPAAPGAADRELLDGVSVIRYHYFPIHSLETLCYPGAIVPRIREKKVRALLVPWLFIALYRNLRKMRDDYDIVQANWLIPQGIVQSFIKKPYIVTGHGGDVTSLNKGLLKKLKKKCLKNAYGVTAVSEPLMQVLNKIYENSNQAVIPMGCDTKIFGREFRKENYFNQNGRKVILFVGRLAEKKGVCYAIEAMRYVDNAMLVIAGDGPLRNELTAQAEGLCRETGKEIVFIGAKTHEELKEIYASADIFVMPSVTAKDGDKEGFGLVMLEAFASGLPIVASRSGGIVDLVKDGVNGYLVPEKDSKGLADRINLVFKDDCIYNSMQAEAYRTAKQYDYSIIAKKYAEFMGLIA
ncbi:MAG: glycosyltransferase family 4 protein [Lachnospira sp.]|nr:glycosyltransferase family 4 protein [Lachnospira sp.]